MTKDFEAKLNAEKDAMALQMQDERESAAAKLQAESEAF